MNVHMALLVFIIVLVAQLGFPIPTVPVLVPVVALATGRMSFMTVFAAAASGSVLADSIWFATGRIYGLRHARSPRGIGALAWLVTSIEGGFDRWGGRLLMVVKLIPGLSMIAIPMAGAMRMDWRRFILFSSIGGMLWASLELAVSRLLSSHIPTLHSKPWLAGVLLLGLAIGSCAICVRARQRDRVPAGTRTMELISGVALSICQKWIHD
jgi:membrane protein DedA with SNARE-associated domain